MEKQYYRIDGTMVIVDQRGVAVNDITKQQEALISVNNDIGQLPIFNFAEKIDEATRILTEEVQDLTKQLADATKASDDNIALYNAATDSLKALQKEISDDQNIDATFRNSVVGKIEIAINNVLGVVTP